MNCANISYISLSTFLLIREESGHARRDTVERSGRIFTRRVSASAPHNASVIGAPPSTRQGQDSNRSIRGVVNNKILNEPILYSYIMLNSNSATSGSSAQKSQASLHTFRKSANASSTVFPYPYSPTLY